MFSWVDWSLVALILVVAFADWVTTALFVRQQGKEAESNPFLREVIENDQVPVKVLVVKLIVMGILAISLIPKDAVLGLFFAIVEMVIGNLTSMGQFLIHKNFGILQLRTPRDRVVLAVGNLRGYLGRAVFYMIVGVFVLSAFNTSFLVWLSIWEMIFLILQLFNLSQRWKEFSGGK